MKIAASKFLKINVYRGLPKKFSLPAIQNIALCIALLACGASIACAAPSAASSESPSDAEAQRPATAKKPRVHFLLGSPPTKNPQAGSERAQQRQISFDVEVANTPQKRAQGLMERTDLPASRGMLFVFPTCKIQTFWMANTPLALDMIFIDAEKKVVGIVDNAPPLSRTPQSVGIPSCFVLEIQGTLSQNLGIQTGAQVEFEDVDLSATR